MPPSFLVSVVPLAMALLTVAFPAPAKVRAKEPASSVPPRVSVPALLVIVPGVVTKVTLEFTALVLLLVRAVAPAPSVMVPPVMMPPLVIRSRNALVPARVTVPKPDLVRVVPLVMALARVTLPKPTKSSAMEPAFRVPPSVRVPALLVIVPGAVVRVMLELTALLALFVTAVAPEFSVMTPPVMMPPLVIRSVKPLVPASVSVPAPDFARLVPLLMALAKVTLPAPEASSACDPASKVPVKFNEDAAFVTRVPPPAPSVTLAEIVAAPVVLTTPSSVKALPPIE